MSIITSQTPGVTSALAADLNGKYVVLRANSGRFAHPLLQLHKATGGSGCSPDSLGSGVFVRPLFVESPEGSGQLRYNNASPDADDGTFKARRGDVIGIVDGRFVDSIAATSEHSIPAVDKNDLVVMAAEYGRWFKAATVKEALKGLGKRTLKNVIVVVVHRETWISDFGGVMSPRHTLVPGREPVQWVFNNEELRPNLKKAEEMAAAFIAAARG